MKKNVKVDEAAKGERLDHYLAKIFSGDFSRARLQGLIKEGCVFLDGQQVLRNNIKLAPHQEIELVVPPLQEAKPVPESIALEVLLEDKDILVVNKPVGLVVHPGNGCSTGTLVHALLFHCGDSLSGIGGVKRPGIVHRLDKDTSGIMVVAKNDQAHINLSQQFADHGRTNALERRYVALCWGEMRAKKGSIDAPLGRSERDRTKRAVVSLRRPDAKQAITHYRVLQRFAMKDAKKADISLVECWLETGRTHQIRVHMAYIGCPLIGDRVYGSHFQTKAKKFPSPLRERLEDFSRQALCAQTLQFSHPKTGEILRFKTDLPQDMQKLLEALQPFTV